MQRISSTTIDGSHGDERGRKLAAGAYKARHVLAGADLSCCLDLRRAAFRGGLTSDQDAFDRHSTHVLLTDRRDGQALACFRYRVLAPADLGRCYTGQFYDLSPLATEKGPFVELGRVAVAPGRGDADLLRLLFAALTGVALGARARLIFGCSSFPGADPRRHAAALAWLGAQPGQQVAIRARAAADVPEAAPDPAGVPQLLRSYLGLGARVGAEAVVDRDLDTIHLFTRLALADVPAARARTLRRLFRASLPDQNEKAPV